MGGSMGRITRLHPAMHPPFPLPSHAEQGTAPEKSLCTPKKWPDQLFPTVKFSFSHEGLFGLEAEGVHVGVQG